MPAWVSGPKTVSPVAEGYVGSKLIIDCVNRRQLGSLAKDMMISKLLVLGLGTGVLSLSMGN